jgi:hypothetical protein
MDPHDKQLLEETAELSKENNKMLRSMLRATRWSQVLSLAKWFLIIAVTVGAYYYIQPYLEMLIRIYTGISDTAGISIPDLDIGKLREAIQNF